MKANRRDGTIQTGFLANLYFNALFGKGRFSVVFALYFHKSLPHSHKAALITAGLGALRRPLEQLGGDVLLSGTSSAILS